MNKLILAIVLLVSIFSIGCTDSEEKPTEPAVCESWVTRDAGDAFQACRSANVDSWPIRCEGDAVPMANCDFAVELPDGSTTLCRISANVCDWPE